LDLDPFWLTAWNYTRRYGDEGIDRIWRRLRSRPFRFPWLSLSLDETLSNLPDNLMPVSPISVHDLDNRFPFWEWRASVEGFSAGMSPVRIKICLRPGAVEVPRLGSDRYRILYETRPVATLYSNPRRFRRPLVGGLSTGVGPNIHGTLGGILRDHNDPSRKYGLTCAHVMTTGPVDQPAQADSIHAKQIGSCGTHTPLQLPQGQACTPYTTQGVNEVDAALIDIDPNTAADLEVLDIGPLTGITPRPNVTQGQMVEFTGRTAGNRTVKVGGLGVIYELPYGGTKYCFKNVFELRWPRFYQLIARRPIARGDSGAWVCIPDPNGYGWCGMIIGGDRLQGYAVYSQTIEDWWQNQGLSLAVT
jgi:hypothetical protein